MKREHFSENCGPNSSNYYSSGLYTLTRTHSNKMNDLLTCIGKEISGNYFDLTISTFLFQNVRFFKERMNSSAESGFS
jgi:hypothetical protein